MKKLTVLLALVLCLSLLPASALAEDNRYVSFAGTELFIGGNWVLEEIDENGIISYENSANPLYYMVINDEDSGMNVKGMEAIIYNGLL